VSGGVNWLLLAAARTGGASGRAAAPRRPVGEVARLDELLAREADVAQRADAVLDDAVVDQQVLADGRARDHQHRLHQPVTLAQYSPAVRALRTHAPIHRARTRRPVGAARTETRD